MFRIEFQVISNLYSFYLDKNLKGDFIILLIILILFDFMAKCLKP